MAHSTTYRIADEAEIAAAQAEFESLWLKVSQGGAPPARYRELRQVLDDLWRRFVHDCGHVKGRHDGEADDHRRLASGLRAAAQR